MITEIGEDPLRWGINEIMQLNPKDRFDRGKPGEICAMMTLNSGIIKHGGHFRYTPQVTADMNADKRAWINQVYCQRVNGDIEFLNPITMKIEFIDVKNGVWISESSLTDFREDGWFLLNAWYRPTQEDIKAGKRTCIHFMVKACTEFKEFVRNNAERTARKIDGTSKMGYEISYKDMRPEWLYAGLDQVKYSNTMRRLWDAITETRVI